MTMIMPRSVGYGGDGQALMSVTQSAGAQLGHHNIQVNTFGRGRPQVRWPHRVGVVPAPADCWQQREVTREVLRTLAGEQRVMAAEVLSGLGGVGKTQIAAHLARTAWDRRRVDLLVWINASSPDTLVSGYARAGVDVAGADPAEPDAAAERFLAWLAEDTRQIRWLIVLDDLTDPAHLAGRWPPTTPFGRTVVTTRRRDAALQSRGTITPVGVFTAGEAGAYVRAKLRDTTVSSTDIAGLAADLGYLPLALAQAATYIMDRGISITDYRARFADRCRQIADLVPEASALPDDHHVTVAVTWWLSIQAADRLQPVGLAKPVLRLLSLLDPNGAPIGVLSNRQSLNLLTTARREHQPAAAEVDVATARDGLHCLYRLHLASPGGNDELPTAQVHALVQRTAREQTSADERAQYALAAADALVHMWPPATLDPAVNQLMHANANALRLNAEETLWRTGAHRLLFRIGSSYVYTGQTKTAIDYFHDLAETARGRLGSDHPDTLTSRRFLAFSRSEAGDAAAAETAFQDLLTDELRVLGPDHPHTLITRSNLAYLRLCACDTTGAALAFQALLPDCLRVWGPDNPNTLIVRCHHAYSCREATDATIAVFQELLADCLRVLGPDHPNTLTTRRHFARWRGESGDAAGATVALQELLTDELRVLGPDHPHTLISRNNLARWRGESGDAAGAAGAYEDLLTHCLRVRGPDHPDTLNARHNVSKWRRVVEGMEGSTEVPH